jgi:hypothetical protein
MGMTALDIIQLLGGVTAVKTHLGVPLTTVSSWGRSNQIPEWRQGAMLELANRLNVALSTADFPPPEARVKLGKAA